MTMHTLADFLASLFVELRSIQALADLPRPYPDEPVVMLARPEGLQ